MYRMYHLYYPGTPMGLSLWILVFGGCQIIISLVRTAHWRCPARARNWAAFPLHRLASIWHQPAA